MYDYLVLVGRFQPFHLGHQAVIELALEKSQNVIVLVGSANVHRSTRNPWTFEEREDMIEKSCHHLKKISQDLIIEPLNDYTYNDVSWVSAVRTTIGKHIKPDSKVGIIGFNKDYTSYYLKMFKGFEVEEIPNQFGTLNATQIRQQFYQEAPIISDFIPDEIRASMKVFAFSDTFKWLLSEYNYVKDYKKAWESSPFTPIFQTADCVVTQSDLILLVTRGGPPYKGALALPGGFVNPKELIFESAVRELREETKISDHKGEIPPAMLKSFVENKDGVRFEDPDRSDRGRTITHAFHFNMPKREEMFNVIGSDDAAHAQWYDLSKLKVKDFMEDHAFIIQKMLSITMD